MAVTIENFNIIEGERIYTPSSYIASRNHCRVDLKRKDCYGDKVPTTDWDLVNNSIVFRNDLDTNTYSQVCITISTDGEGLNISAPATEIVANNINSVNSTSDHINDIIEVRLRYLGTGSTAPTTRYDGSEIKAGDYYFDTDTNIYKTWNGNRWVIYDGGQYCDQNKGIGFLYTHSNTDETINIPEGTNGYSVGNYTLEDGAELVVPDGSVYKIL